MRLYFKRFVSSIISSKMAIFVGPRKDLGCLSVYLILFWLPGFFQFPQEDSDFFTDYEESVNLRIPRGKYNAWYFGGWCYQDAECSESNWPPMCTTGTAQSPIQLPDLNKTSCSIQNFPRSAYVLPKFSLESNGKFVSIKLVDSKWPSFEWQEQKATYNLESIHMHWGSNNSVGSEHKIASKALALEIHMVHLRADFKTLEIGLNSGKKNAFAVLSVLFEVDPNLKTNIDLQPIVENMHGVQDPMAKVRVEKKLNLGAFMKGEMAYHYFGSLSKPGCKEVVTWLVWKEPNKISPSDLAALRTAMNANWKPMVNNFRSLQKTNNRKVSLCQVKYTTQPKESEIRQTLKNVLNSKLNDNEIRQILKNMLNCTMNGNENETNDEAY